MRRLTEVCTRALSLLRLFPEVKVRSREADGLMRFSKTSRTNVTVFLARYALYEQPEDEPPVGLAVVGVIVDHVKGDWFVIVVVIVISRVLSQDLIELDFDRHEVRSALVLREDDTTMLWHNTATHRLGILACISCGRVTSGILQITQNPSAIVV
jgi:hypothetical protein